MNEELTDYERLEYTFKDAFRETYSRELLDILGTEITEAMYTAFVHGYIRGMKHDE
jgi:hypothetical protein